jgi:hypothetical protein
MLRSCKQVSVTPVAREDRVERDERPPVEALDEAPHTGAGGRHGVLLLAGSGVMRGLSVGGRTADAG